MTSTITLYKDSKIIPSKNFLVEGIETYLAGLTKIIKNDYQYLRNDLKLFIKLNRSQDFVESIYSNNYNYLKVSQNGVNYYYFIVKKTQVSQETIGLELEMDTANTYPWNTAFSVSPRTRVIREHKDRLKLSPLFNATLSGLSLSGSSIEISKNTPFLLEDRDGNTIEVISPTGDRLDPFAYINLDIRPTNETDAQKIRDGFIPDTFIFGETRFAFNEGEIDIEPDKNLVRIIDYYSEGITPVLYKEELGNLESKENLTWNLAYRNATDDANTAIQCFAFPSNGEVKVLIPASKTLTYEDFEDGINYIFAPWSGNYTLVDNDGVKYNVKAQYSKWICKNIRRSGTTLQIRGVHYEGLSTGSKFAYTNRIVYSWRTITSITFEQEEISYYKNVSIPPQAGTLPELFPDSNGFFSSTTSISTTLNTLQNIDRVDPKLIKIITIPYFPSNYTYNEETFEMTTDETWTFESSVYRSLSLNDLNARFSRIVESSINNPLNIFNLYEIQPNANELRNDKYESKLFHSDFYQPKFVYDSFGFVFELEKIDEEKFNPSEKFTFEFVMTSTINSKFMFKFPEYILKLSTQDYDNILPVSRNNEAPIYNSSYITYLRTAYRYDLKYLEQNTGLTYLGAVGDTINAMTGAYSKGTGKNASVGGALLTAGMGLINTLASSIANLNSNEWQLQAKKEQLKNQANSVSGSDDLDLLENYSGNRAKLCLYQVSPRMKQLLADLFYYYGYTTDEIKIPEVNTRYWFNFLSCELEFTGLDKNISDLAKDNLIQRYNAGITFLHEHNGEWDFDQVKENWETILL